MSVRRNPGICELGPIRPPSESTSLLIRATRNCPWNKCLFCPVYKNVKFEKRDEAAVIAEIDLLADAAARVRARTGLLTDTSELSDESFLSVARDPSATYEERRAALWMHRGGRHVFLQDADSLIRPAHRIEKILRRIQERFPTADRITTYARSRTLAAKSIEQLKSLRAAGLTRVHVGLESGADSVLALVQKGCLAADHIEGIGRAVEAGFEVCCYVMPGLGGKALSEAHVKETARVLRAVDPHHVRLRTMFLTKDIPLFEKVRSGEMTLLEEDEVIAEIRELVSRLRGARGRVVSDHDHNLLMNIEGHLTDDAALIDARLALFLDLPQDLRDGFIVARRFGHLRSLEAFLDNESLQRDLAPTVVSLRQDGDGSLRRGLERRITPRLF